MKNKRLAALLTSFTMMLSTGTAALTSHAADNVPVTAADTADVSQTEIHYCEMCGAELPEGTNPSPIGVWVCDRCHSQGMGGTTIPRTTTATTTEGPICTTTDPNSGNVAPPEENEDHFFLFSILCFDDNSVIDSKANAKIRVDYEDGTTDSFYYPGTGCYVDKKGMNGTISIISANDEYVIDNSIAKTEFPADYESIVLYLKKAPEVTEPVEGEELGIYVLDVDTNELVGAAYLEIYYDDYTTEELFSSSERPVIHKHDGRTGTISLLGVPNGYEIVGSDEYNFIGTSQYARFYVKGQRLSTTTTATVTTTTTSVITQPDTTTSYIRTSPMSSLELDVYDFIAPDMDAYVNYDSFMVSWLKISSDNPYLVPEASEIKINNNAKGYFVVSCLRGAPDGTGTITVQYNNWLTGEVAEKEITFTINQNVSVTTCTGTTTYPGQYHRLLNISGEVVLAVDKNGIVFDKNGQFTFTEFGYSFFKDVKPGMKLNVSIMYDTSQNDQIINVSDLCVTEENCKVERTMDGDSNCDGEVNMADAVLIMQAVTNPDKYGIGLTTGINLRGESNADSDGDGVTQKDALRIQRFKLGIIKLENNKKR
ncbi:MAG: dockerin type I repeat-containing protein [Ruminococcus sp.]|nr:dockerin type I repeat-containing protein [Ruminococcus sp.]